MNKNLNTIFSIVGLLSQFFYLYNAFNIWFRCLTVKLKDIYFALPKMLIIIVGLILIFISMIFHKDNYKFVNIINYIAIIVLIISTGLLVMPW